MPDELKYKPFLVGPTHFDQERFIYLDAIKYRGYRIKCKKNSIKNLQT